MTPNLYILSGDNMYNIYNITPYNAPTLFLDIADGSTANGVNIRLYTANNTTAQKYALINSKGYIQLRSSKNTFIDTDEGTENPVSGTNVESWAQSNDNSQLWKIVKP